MTLIASPQFRPSEYTAALIHAVMRRPELARGAHALEIGVGSGAVLSAIGHLGAAALCGVDIEPAAASIAAALLRSQGFGSIADIHCGDVWAPLAGRRFDLIVANLPHFPMGPIPHGNRLPSWSAGGTDGRELLDRVLDGLPAHLTAAGRAFLTHNGFVGLDRTRERLRRHDLDMRVDSTILVYVPPEKLALIDEQVWHSERGRTFVELGPHVFAEMHIVEIGARGVLTG